MRLEHATAAGKGWLAGPWDSSLAISVGFATEGIDEPHVHTRVTEIYLVARGAAEVRVEHETIEVRAGDVLIVEPGEAHTFTSSSETYFHFVAHVPGLAGDEAQREKRHVERGRLGL